MMSEYDDEEFEDDQLVIDDFLNDVQLTKPKRGKGLIWTKETSYSEC